MSSPVVYLAPPARSVGRIAELDGVRGIAILLVLVGHFGIPASPNGWFKDAIGFGWIGVDLFFVLSGFLITGILLDSRGSPAYFKRFYLRRVFRIFPIYYLFLLLFFHAAPLLHRATGLLVSTQNGRSDEAWYWLYLANWRSAFDQNRWLRHFWSLCIEEQFYLVWPLLIGLVSRRTLKYLCLGILLLSPVVRFIFVQQGTSMLLLYRATPFRLDGLVCGALLAIATRDPDFRTQLKRFAPVAAIIAAAALLAVIASAGTSYLTPAMNYLGFSSIALLFSVLVFRINEAVGTGARIATWMRARWLVDFGKYSYGLYVWHLPIAERVRPLVESAQHRFGGGLEWVWLVASVIVGIALSYGVALASWNLIEQPFQRIRQRIES